MAEIRYRIPTADDLIYIADHLKDNDYREVVGLVGKGVAAIRQELLDSARQSCFMRTCLIDGEPVAAFGIVRTNPFRKEGIVWLLTTPRTLEHKIFVGRKTKQAMQGFLTEWERLYNFVDAGNELSIKWLKWLGAAVYPAEETGIFGCKYHYFEFKGVK